MSQSPLSVRSLHLIFKDITVKGFSLSDPRYAEKLPQILKQAADLVKDGLLHVPIAAIYPMTQVKAAVAHTARGGKVLLQIAGH